MTTTHLTTVGDSVGIVLPPETVEKLQAMIGDELVLLETPNGVEIMALSPVVASQLKIARQVIAENHDALEELAK